jgi:putative addiction module component (TIGR02574 family)
VSATDILEQIRRLPENERREIVCQILEEFTEVDDDLTSDQIEEAELRAERLSRNPESGIPWEQIRAELPERLKANRKLEESPEFIVELERRAKDALRNPNDCVPWEQIRADLKKKRGWQ